jgi:hypothetical protein
MSDKPIAGLVAAIAVAPLCLVCVVGPVAFGAAAGSALAWLAGSTLPLLTVAATVVGWVAWRAFRRRPQRSPAAAELELKR